LIKKLRNFLPDNSSVLELEMGPEKEMDILKKYIQLHDMIIQRLFRKTCTKISNYRFIIFKYGD